MSTIELLASIVVISGILGALVVISNSLRTESARKQTLDILRHLRDALQAYHTTHDMYPSGPTPDAIAALLADPKAQTYLQGLSPRTDGSGQLVIHDGYGRPVHYLAPTPTPTPAPGSRMMSERPGDRPGDRPGELPGELPGANRAGVSPTATGVDFVSAGADGRLGDIASSDPEELAAVTDNLYGSDTERPQ